MADIFLNIDAELHNANWPKRTDDTKTLSFPSTKNTSNEANEVDAGKNDAAGSNNGFMTEPDTENKVSPGRHPGS